MIGIITQPLCANYGGILQNYALQQVLKRLGHVPVTLDYLPSLSFGRYLLYAGKGALCALLPSKRHPLKPYRHFLQRPADIASFVRDYISTTDTISRYTKRTLKKYRIEAIIVGSDQVWRYAYNSHYLEDMYLDFVKGYPCRRIAYGASFGIEDWDYPEDRASKAKALIKLFQRVSVREQSAVRLCREHLDTCAELVLDPTLLLDAADYEGFCSAPGSDGKPYLAAYILDINAEKRAYIQSVAGARGLEIKDMTVSDNGVSIEEWLTTIRNAEYVITDSYHGSLFSIIFKKQFQTIINKERGTDRFLTVFDQLGLQHRLLDSIPAGATDNGPVDYTLVSAALHQLREGSISFLQKALG